MWLKTCACLVAASALRFGEQSVAWNSSHRSNLDLSQISGTTVSMAVRRVRKRSISGDIRPDDPGRPQTRPRDLESRASTSFPLGARGIAICRLGRSDPRCQRQAAASTSKRLEFAKVERRSKGVEVSSAQDDEFPTAAEERLQL